MSEVRRIYDGTSTTSKPSGKCCLERYISEIGPGPSRRLTHDLPLLVIHIKSRILTHDISLMPFNSTLQLAILTTHNTDCAAIIILVRRQKSRSSCSLLHSTNWDANPLQIRHETRELPDRSRVSDMRSDGVDPDIPIWHMRPQSTHEPDHTVFRCCVYGDRLAVVSGAGDGRDDDTALRLLLAHEVHG